MDYYGSLNAANVDPDIPTIFEILASRQLDNLIRPSLRYLLAHYAQNHPRYLLRLAMRFDDIYLIVFGLVELLYLKNWNSTFVDKFYGLKRVRRLAVPLSHTLEGGDRLAAPHLRLKGRQIAILLFSRTLLPYILEKLRAYHDRLQGRVMTGVEQLAKPTVTGWSDRRIWRYYFNYVVLKVWPKLEATSTVVDIGFTFGYLFGNPIASIYDLVAGTRYARIAPDDSENTNKWLQSLSYALPSALFLLKFTEWWNSSEFGQKLNQQGPTIEPPPLDALPADKRDGCMLCQKKYPETPTALESGAVFCYRCIFEYIESYPAEKQPKCPATGQVLVLTTFDSENGQWRPVGLRRLMV